MGLRPPPHATLVKTEPPARVAAASPSPAHYYLGLTLYLKKDVDAAIKVNRAALDINPKYDKAHNEMGLALMAKKESEAGIAHFNKAIELNPKLVGAQISLGDHPVSIAVPSGSTRAV